MMVIAVLFKWILLASFAFANSLALRDEYSALDQFLPFLRIFKTSASTTLDKISQTRQSKAINIANGVSTLSHYLKFGLLDNKCFRGHTISHQIHHLFVHSI